MQRTEKRTLASIARGSCWFVAVLAIASALMFSLWLVDNLSSEGNRTIPIGALLVGRIFWSVLLMSTVPILIWIYRAHANLAASGLRDLHHSQGWTVLSYFIPVVNFIVPFRAMRELYNRSAGEPEYFAHSSVALVTNWWACLGAALLAVATVSLAAGRYVLPGIYILTPLWAEQSLYILAMIFFAGSAWFLQRLINEITALQSSAIVDSTIFA